jgi:hypothetical protein
MPPRPAGAAGSLGEGWLAGAAWPAAGAEPERSNIEPGAVDRDASKVNNRLVAKKSGR